MYHFELKPSRKSQWAPAKEWEREVEKFFDVFSHNEQILTPACEILDGEKSYVVSLDVPGLSESDIDIEVKDNFLRVSGERRFDEKMSKDSVLRTERRYGKFARVFSLPQNVNPDAIEATFEHGVLYLTLPKEEKSQSRKISIGTKNKTSETH